MKPCGSKLSVEDAHESVIEAADSFHAVPQRLFIRRVYDMQGLNAENRQVGGVKVMGVCRGCARSPGHALVSVQTPATGIAVR